MCFQYDDYPAVYQEDWRTARKMHKCSECHVPIQPGEQYLVVFGIWDHMPERFKICSMCHWLRERVATVELEHGCSVNESYAPLAGLYEALGDGYDRSIGLIDLDCYHERERV